MVKLPVDKALLKARSHMKRGEIAEAEILYKSVLKAFPTNKKAKQGLAGLKNPPKTTTNLNLPQDTIEKLVRLYNTGRLELVIKKAQKLTKIYPEEFVVWNLLGAASAGLGKVVEASQAFKRVIEINPKFADGYNNFGLACQQLGRREEAIKAYTIALKLNPNYASAYNNLGNTLKEIGNLEEAIKAYKKALSLEPNYATVYNNLGNALKDQGKLDEAITAFNKALHLEADNAATYNNIGLTLKDQGKSEKAKESFNRALSLKSDYAKAHRNLSTLVKYKLGNPQIKSVDQLLKRAETNDSDKCRLHYAAAKMKEDIGELEEAFKHFVDGGALRKKLLSYDLKQDQELFSRIKAAANRFENLNLQLASEKINSTPIFILGMPRSGTTLIEQILSCHSKVQAAGELMFLDRYAGKLCGGLKEITSKALLKVRHQYLQELGKISEGNLFVTDKMPQNFLYLGLILKVLPEAKIIHLKRDPAATCWSNFKHYFSASGLGFSNDLSDTVEYFKLYSDLMKFWGRKYSDKIYHLNYDNLTDEQEIETKKLINFLDIGWEDACLSPHSNKRSVRTASQIQVRKKVYKGSSDVWRKFEPYLDGIFDELPEP